jgi:squalene-hopene/tetraprenyl-beta-curcumene cyclase
MNRPCIVALIALSGFASSAPAIDESHRAKGEQVAAKAIAYLKAQQDAKSGGWNVPEAGKGAPTLPAFTGLVLNGMLMQPGMAGDPAVSKGAKFILSYVKSDGGIYDATLPTYNTAICLSTLSRLDLPEAKAAIKGAQDFLRHSQWGDPQPFGVGGAGGKDAPEVVGKEHSFYGGVGYGGHGRPDLSNTQFMLQAMQDSGAPSDDPAVQRALVFLQRLQMLEKAPDGKTVNDQDYAKGSKQGGFIYAAGPKGDEAGRGQSYGTGMIEETLDDGTKVSRLRCYGSMSYAGFKSYLYAGLKKDDPRVVAAFNWIKDNYTLQENPGIGAEGTYYYLVTFARALDATGSATIDLGAGKKVPSGASKNTRDWQNDLVDRLAELQNEDGSFKSVHKRWMEDNGVLITAYSLIAVEHALRD